MKFFITGGAGFIGFYLSTSLKKQSNFVTIYDNFSNSSKEKKISLIKFGINVIEGDILDYHKLLYSMKGHDIVIHLAAQIDVDLSIKNPHFTKQVNIEGTLNVLTSCKKNNIKNFIGISSAAVYGPSEKLPLSEYSSLKPISTYGQSKLIMEEKIKDFCKNNNLNSIILRLFNVYGKGQSAKYSGVISEFFNCVKKNKSLTIFGDGTFTRDFVHVNDVVQAIINAVYTIDGKIGKTYNISSGDSISIRELAELVLSLSHKNLEIKYLPPKEGDIPHSQSSIKLAQKELNFEPKISLVDGLKDLLHNW